MSRGQAARREALAVAADVRVTQTRAALEVAFRQCAEERVPNLGVAEVCRRAGVARSTFYTHFASVDDLAVSVVNDVLAGVAPLDPVRRTARDLSRSEITRMGLGELVDGLWAERSVLLYVLDMASGSALRQRFVASLARGALATVQAERAGAGETELRVASSFFAAGVLQVILDWLRHPGGVVRDELIDALFTVLPAWLTSDATDRPADPARSADG